jgi:hypothetical protein
MLRLSECVNTIVGSEMARGISGGQRKRCVRRGGQWGGGEALCGRWSRSRHHAPCACRVTIAEALIGRPRLLVLDEVTTGASRITV